MEEDGGAVVAIYLAELQGRGDHFPLGDGGGKRKRRDGYGALVLSFPLINGSKSILDVLCVALLSQFCIDRLSSRWTFNCQSTRSSNFI